ncbi:MAG: lipid-A-disaccharide synthase [Trichodesmium sp.]
MDKVDIVILSNGPGELVTWVRPVVQQLRQQTNIELRISLILSPCPHATGKEAAIARSYPEIDRVQAPEYFWQFLLWGKTAENWNWYSQGVVLFLGGDQFFTVVVGKRLGYRTVIYAEWDARWWRWVDKFGVMQSEVVTGVPEKYTDKFTVVGDLMNEVRNQESGVRSQESGVGSSSFSDGESNFEVRSQNSEVKSSFSDEKTSLELIGLLPGSKPSKLSLGVPLTLAIAEYIHKKRPQTRFMIPVAPTLDLTTLANFANPEKNPAVEKMGGVGGNLLLPSNHPLKNQNPKLVTSGGVEIELITRTPAYDLLCQCHLCLTTIGANTAELGSLAVPMIILLPTQQLDIMRAWDGLPGLLANLPGVGTAFAATINWLVLRKIQLLAWPNIWAKQEIVPELVGKLKPETVGELVLDYLTHPEKLAEMSDRLRQVRGKPGAAEKLAKIVLSLSYDRQI